MNVLNHEVLKNYSHVSDCLNLISKFKNNDWNSFQYEFFQSKTKKYLYSNY